ncbi:molybdenum ABC transporter permease [Mucilaginibacter sp. SMC90]|uniref:molybdenum ABC transporter permease n=1 Tax=Mucilaginibacter sp. SMC90 TaxID=2929803 RepID=UPI001FB4FC89|nr:molybdenum ABC transporter permease [Mucilaginibacter sp. SMC90]UOE51311.1 molybdenum ABC transporter permease [Mucilaginibacter sp. SMC90]
MEHNFFNGMVLGIFSISSGQSVELFGGFIVLIGLALRYWINRRRFNRRNGAGVQLFSSYEKKVVLTLGERLLKLLGLVFIFFGIYVMLAGYAQREHEPKQTPSTQAP